MAGCKIQESMKKARRFDENANLINLTDSPHQPGGLLVEIFSVSSFFIRIRRFFLIDEFSQDQCYHNGAQRLDIQISPDRRKSLMCGSPMKHEIRTS